MSFRRRLIRVVQSNLNSLRRRERETSSEFNVEELSDAELEASLRRKKLRREAPSRIAAEPKGETVWRDIEEAIHQEASARTRATQSSIPHVEHVLRNQRDPELVRLYTQLECAYGADLSTVKKQYRALMRRYHPDRHTQSPEKQAIATELTQKLTQAYHELTKRLH